MKKVMAMIMVLYVAGVVSAIAQPEYGMLDPKPYNPEVDADIDQFISSWKESTPRVSYGSLIERDILTSLEGDDPIRPTKRGAVLTYIKRLSYSTLQAGKSTTPSTPEGEQVAFYIDEGTGVVKSGDITADLHKGVCVFVPVGVEFVLTNTGDGQLKMYVFAEPVSPDFTPAKGIIVKDENTTPIGTTKSHWSHILRVMFYHDEALDYLTGFCPVWFDPMTLGQPHSHGAGSEEIWFVVEGELVLHLGKELRRLTPGMAYKIPPNGVTPHSNMNVSGEQIKLFWVMAHKK